MSERTALVDRLEFELADLAAAFRAARNQPDKQAAIVQSYARVMDELFATGEWTGAPDVDAQLPDEFMPLNYRRFWEQLENPPPLSSWDATGTDVSSPT